MTIQELKKNSFLTLKNKKRVFIKGDYCRINKAWECTSFDDISAFKYLKKGTLVKEVDM